MTESWGRGICWLLAATDAVLGLGATLAPSAYLSVVHPHLPVSGHPYDWVVRTGALWLMFLVFELLGALSRAPAKWFFCVAMLRWMEVPADIVYGLLARGTSTLSQCAIFTAPVVNAIAGTLLLVAFRRARKQLQR